MKDPNAKARVEEMETLQSLSDAPTQDTSAGTADVDTLFPQNWDRYEKIDCLGQGGMGRVYRVYDPRLRRQVALKLLAHNDDLQSSRRFIEEARAQARVDHPNICKVYEVGDINGQPFIAMQLIEGETLEIAAQRWTWETCIRVMRQVAEALHHAHRVGLIHRDIKPANILVSLSEEGEYFPTVLDFGLARLVADDGLTAGGQMLGTPRYMAPEQVRGESRELDRRCDVYGLGATLYRLLVGKPLFSERTSGGLYLAVLEQDITLADLPADLSPDVAAIILQCLKKSRQHRYASAKALADDLGRYLDGDPVQARPVGPWRRLVKKARKHKQRTLAGVLVLSLILALAAWGGHSSWDAARREQAARTFTAYAKDVAVTARFAYLSPRHDLTDNKTRIRQLLHTIAQAMDHGGAAARSPGLYAMGLGNLALGDLEQARTYLERAWRDHGNARARWALGQVYGALFNEERARMMLIRDEASRSRQLKALSERYLYPARDCFQNGRPPGNQSNAYETALVYKHEGLLDQALVHLDKPEANLPWFFESRQLRGDIYLTQALHHQSKGETIEALANFRIARSAFDEAADIAPSYAPVYRHQARIQLALLDQKRFADEDLTPLLEQGLTDIQHALILNPTDGEALLLRAQLNRTMAEHYVAKSQDPFEFLTKAIEAAEAAAAVLTDPSEAHYQRGVAFRLAAQKYSETGRPYQTTLDRAAQALALVKPLHHDHRYLTDMGWVHHSQARLAENQGQDAGKHWRAAIDAYREAVQLKPELARTHISLGMALYHHARGMKHNPEQALARFQEAIDALAVAGKIQKDSIYVHLYQGRCLLEMSLCLNDGKGAPYLAQALEALQRGLAVSPTLAMLHGNLADVYQFQAVAAWKEGKPWEVLMNKADAAHRKALALSPGYTFAYQNLGVVAKVHGGYLRLRGDDPTHVLQQAIDWSQQAADRGLTFTPTWCKAEAQLELALYHFQQGRDVTHACVAIGEAFTALLNENPKDSSTLHSLGRLYHLEAGLAIQQGNNPSEAFDRAHAAFDQALALTESDAELKLDRVRCWITQALWQKSGTSLEAARGLLATLTYPPDEVAYLIQMLIWVVDPDTTVTPPSRFEGEWRHFRTSRPIK